MRALMAVIKKTRRPMVPMKSPPKRANLYQLRIDHLFSSFGHPVRVTILKYLNRARENGPQAFSSVLRALNSLGHDMASSNLVYHLNGLKEIEFIEHQEDEGYSITQLGRKLVDKYFEIEEIFDDLEILTPNILAGHLYESEITAITAATSPFEHYQIEVTILPREKPDPVDAFIRKAKQEERAASLSTKKNNRDARLGKENTPPPPRTKRFDDFF